MEDYFNSVKGITLDKVISYLQNHKNRIAPDKQLQVQQLCDQIIQILNNYKPVKLATFNLKNHILAKKMKIYRLCQTEDYENIEEAIEWGGYSIDTETIENIVHRDNLSYDKYGDLVAIDNKYWFTLDGTYEPINDICSYIANMDSDECLTLLDVSINQVYNPYMETSMENYPDKVYHFTNYDIWEDEIKPSGYLSPSSGTGLNNRDAYGVFTTIDPQEYVDGTYGDLCLEIDLERFMADMNDDGKIDVSMEPEVLDYLLKETVCSKLGVECMLDYPSDISGSTLVINSKIPLEYVRPFV